MITNLEQMKTDLQQSIFFNCPWQVDIRYDIKWQAWKRQIPQKVLTAPFLTSSHCLFFRLREAFLIAPNRNAVKKNIESALR
jgi:hypothetical protein